MAKKKLGVRWRCCCLRTTNLILFAIVIAIGLLQSSCSTTCFICGKDNTKIYHVELNEDGSEFLEIQEFFTYYRPDSLQRGRKKHSYYVVDCGDDKPFKIDDEQKLKQFVDRRRVEINSKFIEKITRTSDADLPPLSYSGSSDAVSCSRYRQAIKLEARIMAGSRIDANPYYKPGSDAISGTPAIDPYDPGIFAFSENGGYGIVGVEGAALPRIFTINNKHSFNVGPMVGFWPVDGGMFIPISLHPRLTFNDITDPFKGNWLSCNAMYLFGDYGLSYKLGNDAVLNQFSNGLSGNHFWDIGVGIDFTQSPKRKRDWSVDIGFRQTTHELPLSTEVEECIENGSNRGVSSLSNCRTSRTAPQVFFRIGYTW